MSGTVIKKKAKKKGKQIKFTDFKPASNQEQQETVFPRQSQPPAFDKKFPSSKNITSLPGANLALSQKSRLPGANLPQTQQQYKLPGANLPPAFSANPFQNMQQQFQNNQNPFPPNNQNFFPQQAPFIQNQLGFHPPVMNDMMVPQNQSAPKCVKMANQAHQIAQSILPPQMQANFSNIFNDFVFQVGTNPNYDANSAAKKMMQQLNPYGGSQDDFEDYTQQQHQSKNVMNPRQMTNLDHKMMEMMERKFQKQIDNEIKATEENKYKEICKFYMSGNCKFGPSCRYQHPVQNESAISKVNFEGDKECCICYEFVKVSNKQFGLLSNYFLFLNNLLAGCDHPFCLECIRKWRGQVNYQSSGKDQARLCPICRKQSYVVLPSNGYVRGPQKTKMMDIYRARLKQLPCKHFNFGNSKCPFLNSCFYSHRLKNGAEFEYPFQTPQFSMKEEQWIEDRKNDQTLADMIGDRS